MTKILPVANTDSMSDADILMADGRPLAIRKRDGLQGDNGTDAIVSERQSLVLEILRASREGRPEVALGPDDGEVLLQSEVFERVETLMKGVVQMVAKELEAYGVYDEENPPKELVEVLGKAGFMASGAGIHVEIYGQEGVLFNSAQDEGDDRKADLSQLEEWTSVQVILFDPEGVSQTVFEVDRSNGIATFVSQRLKGTDNMANKQYDTVRLTSLRDDQEARLILWDNQEPLVTREGDHNTFYLKVRVPSRQEGLEFLVQALNTRAWRRLLTKLKENERGSC